MPERPIRLSEIMLKGAVQTFLELLKGNSPTYISILVGFKMFQFLNFEDCVNMSFFLGSFGSQHFQNSEDCKGGNGKLQVICKNLQT